MKRFLIKISYTLFPVWLMVVGIVVYYNVLVIPNTNGDLGRLGKIPLPKSIESEMTDIKFEDIYDGLILKDTVVDVITIGDSFSRQGIDGYQNYLAAKGMSLLNFRSSNWNSFETAYDLMNLGYIDSAHVKTVIIEIVERNVVNAVTNMKIGNDSIEMTNNTSASKEENKWSLLEAKNYVLLRLGYKNPVRHCKLLKPMFSSEQGSELYFYQDDLLSFTIGEKEGKLIKSNINIINDKADSLGIKIMYIICPDKFDVYQDYIDCNPYPQKVINEDLRVLFPDNRHFIIAKELIMPYIRKGEKDMYHLNDTHWSCKSANVVADELFTIITHNY